MKISTYTYYFAVLFLVLIFFLGLLKGPIVPDDIQSKNCARNVVLPFNFGVTLNCDSGIYIRLASDLNLLFENTRVVNDRNLTPGNVEQATPGSSVLVWIISKPIIKIWKSIQFYTDYSKVCLVSHIHFCIYGSSVSIIYGLVSLRWDGVTAIRIGESRVHTSCLVALKG